MQCGAEKVAGNMFHVVPKVWSTPLLSFFPGLHESALKPLRRLGSSPIG